MAYTNTIALAEQYKPILDDIYKRESITARLDSANPEIRFVGGNKIEIFEYESDGLANTNRNGQFGFVGGDAVGRWVPYTLVVDRNRSFQIDSMDDEETIGMMFSSLTGKFMKNSVIPELDAYRFAKYASTSGILAATPVDITSSVDGNDLIATAEMDLNDAEVPVEGRILFVSELFYKNIKDNITRYVDNDAYGIKRTFEYYDNMPVVRVPKSRFNSKITLYDGTTSGQEAGGFIVPTDGTSYPINFLIIHPSAVAQVVKHEIPRIWTPAQNINADAWKYDYRVYHDTFVLNNKKTGIYLCKAATANS